MLRILLKRTVGYFAVFVAASAVLAGACPAVADNISLIRDAETENTIREFATPVFRAAKLEPSAIKIHLVRDNTLNAFVAGGQRLFINTGLLIQAPNAEQLIGVIAHETGHIAGGHLARIHDALKGSTAATILSMVLGGIAIGAGRGDVGSVIIAGGQSLAQRSLLSYTRTQEASADQAALKYLDEVGISSRGLMDFMEILGDQEFVAPERQDPYVRTHPLTRDRIDNIAAHLKRSPSANAVLPPRYDRLYSRIRAKLFGYLNPLAVTLRLYREDDNSLESRYARTFAHYRAANLAEAVGLIDGLIAEHPNDPYFHETKGQILFEAGNAVDALAPYQTAVDLLPDNDQIRIELARVQMTLGGPEKLKSAVTNLRAALIADRNSSFAWRQLAIAYSHLDDKGNSSLALAETALLERRYSEARYHAGLAERLFARGSRGWLQAQDILIAARPKNRDK